LPRSTSRPLLVGVSLGIAAVEDDRGVVGDSERPQRSLELARRSAVPVLRILEPVRVEIQRTRDVTLLVLLGDPEIDVKEQEPVDRRGLRSPSIEQLPQPCGVDKLVVVLEPLDRQGLIGCPHGPTILVPPDARVA
jgi:hypothetical protein